MIKIPHNNFCVLPWVSLETSPTGTVRPCCLAMDEICDDSGKKFHLVDSSFDQLQSSQHMKTLRQQFLNGEKPTTCQRCWKEEESGRTSKRMHTLNRLKHIVDDSCWGLDAKPLLFLDLKLGNICNLKCRICGSWSSSTYATEQLHTVPKSQQKQNYHYIMLRAGAWPKESSVFWDEIEKHVGEIRYIEFTGGEPFMIREHFSMLKSLVDKGIAYQVEIHYNTNGTQWPEDAEEIWKHFKTVEIAFSIDDLGERFEYQRSNAIWSEVTENLQRFREVRSRHQNIQLQVCSTVNIFNIWHLEKLAEWIDMQGFDFVYWNMLHEPQHFCIASLPLDAKKLVCHRLETAMVREFHRREFSRIRDFMMAGASLPVEEITKSLRQLDQLRNQDLRDVIWELAEVLEYAAT